VKLRDAALVSSIQTVDGPGDKFVDVAVHRLDALLDQAHSPSTIDFMSVDVEGFEDEALLTFPFDRWRVLAMCIERPSAALSARLDSNGFRSMGTIDGLDSFFVHPDVRDAQPYVRRPWTRLQYRLEAAIHRLEAWGVLRGDSADWGHSC